MCRRAVKKNSNQIKPSNFFFLETARAIEAKFYVEPHWDGGTKVCSNGPGHMTHKPKLDKIKLLLNSSSKLDILGLCETFPDENTDDNILQMDGFNFERKDRAALRQGTLNTKRGGDVVVYIADHIRYKRRNDLESSEIESIWLESNLKATKPFLISSVYRPPSSNVQWINEVFVHVCLDMTIYLRNSKLCIWAA